MRPGPTPSDVALLDRISGDLADDAALADVVAELAAHSVVDETAALARHWSREARRAISSLPEGAVKEALDSFADALVARAS